MSPALTRVLVNFAHHWDVQRFGGRRFGSGGLLALSVKIRNKSVIAQTIIVGLRYCLNMKKYLVLVLFTLFAAGAFAQPYRHHRHHRHHHPHAVAVR
jgi:hypothetical protein